MDQDDEDLAGLVGFEEDELGAFELGTGREEAEPGETLGFRELVLEPDGGVEVAGEVWTRPPRNLTDADGVVEFETSAPPCPVAGRFIQRLRSGRRMAVAGKQASRPRKTSWLVCFGFGRLHDLGRAHAAAEVAAGLVLVGFRLGGIDQSLELGGLPDEALVSDGNGDGASGAVDEEVGARVDTALAGGETEAVLE